MPLFRTGSKVAALLALAGISALVGLAPAKPAPRVQRSKPLLPSDGGVTDAVREEPQKAPPLLDATDSGASNNGPTSTPFFGDSGVRLSPLTPAPPELPPILVSNDAGAPVDYDRLLADIAALRARAAAVSDTLFHSRVSISIQATGDHSKTGRLVVSLDDGAVYSAEPSVRLNEMTPIYSHALAPGRHALTVDIERRDDHDDTFKSSQRSRMTIVVPRDQELAVEISLDDDSNMGRKFTSDQRGHYEMRVRTSASARPIKK